VAVGAAAARGAVVVVGVGGVGVVVGDVRLKLGGPGGVQAAEAVMGGGVDDVAVGVGPDLLAEEPYTVAREPHAAGVEPDTGVGAGHRRPAVVGAGIRVGAVHD